MGQVTSNTGNNPNDEEFKKLVESTQKRVRNICCKFLNNSEEAYDTAQEVYLQIYESFTGNDLLNLPESWIYRIAVTKSIDRIRHNKRKKRFGSVSTILKIGETTTDPPAEGTPQSIIEDKQRNEILFKAIDLLPENQKIAIVLNKIEGFTNTDIAKIMGTSKNSVDSYIFKARNKLRKLLTKYYNDLA